MIIVTAHNTVTIRNVRIRGRRMFRVTFNGTHAFTQRRLAYAIANIVRILS